MDKEARNILIVVGAIVLSVVAGYIIDKEAMWRFWNNADLAAEKFWDGFEQLITKICRGRG